MKRTAILFLCFVSFPALAVPLPADECNLTGNAQSCPAIAGEAIGQDATSSNPEIIYSFDATRSDQGNAITPIDAWGYCRYVDNGSAEISIFVPFKSAYEWTAFIFNAPRFVTLVKCSRPGTVGIPSDATCGAAPEAKQIPIYARPGSTYDLSASFDCGGWTETAAATYGAAPDNDVIGLPTGGWVLLSIVYSGSPPPTAPSTPPVSPSPPAPVAPACIDGTITAGSSLAPNQITPGPNCGQDNPAATENVCPCDYTQLICVLGQWAPYGSPVCAAPSSGLCYSEGC